MWKSSSLSSMANSACVLLSGSGMMPHSLHAPPAFLYLSEVRILPLPSLLYTPFSHFIPARVNERAVFFSSWPLTPSVRGQRSAFIPLFHAYSSSDSVYFLPWSFCCCLVSVSLWIHSGNVLQSQNGNCYSQTQLCHSF